MSLPARSAMCVALALAVVVVPAGAGKAAKRTTQRATREGSETVKRVSDELRVVLARSEEVLLEASPLPGEGLHAFCRRLTGSTKIASELEAQQVRGRALRKDVFLRLPFSALTAETQKLALAALFPDDRPVAAGWEHVVRAYGRGGNADEGESLWALAVWFTGDGTNYRAIRDHNKLAKLDTAKGQKLVIPRALLLPQYQPATALAADEAGEDRAGQSMLEYVQENGQKVAVYRLRKGEALYSSVVVRFTGRLHAEEVNGLAAEIAQYNCIDDVTDIPIGYPVKVPLAWVTPEYLPAGDERRATWENALLEAAQFKNRVTSFDLSGIDVILDAGHGGRDIGTQHDGVWESVYVYDIAVRLKTFLEKTTNARVYVTTKDDTNGYTVPNRDVLPRSRGHYVLTKPRYRMDDPVVGVNLRWYLVNSYYRRILKGNASEKGKKPGKEGAEDRTVFISLHADSLHPSVRGAMMYIPGARLLGKPFGKNGDIYLAREEVREQPRVDFTRHQCVKSEGLSRDLAEHIVGAFERNDLAVHPFNPVREQVIRQKREWVPAILRYNEVPAKLLLEVCNLANPEDRKLMTSRAWRQKVAESIAEAVSTFYDAGPAPKKAAVKAAK